MAKETAAILLREDRRLIDIYALDLGLTKAGNVAFGHSCTQMDSINLESVGLVHYLLWGHERKLLDQP